MRSTNRLAWATLGACVSLALAGCGVLDGDEVAGEVSTPTRGGLLDVVVPDDLSATGWDPSAAEPVTFRVAAPMVMASLLRPDPAGGEPTPWLAQVKPNDTEGRRWTVTIEAGASFEDGTLVTAEDVAFTLEEGAAQPDLASRFGSDAQGSWFVSAEATSESSVLVELREGNPLFPRLVAAAPEFGCLRTDYGGLSREQYLMRPSSCGPYAIVESDATGIRLGRNAAYLMADTVIADELRLTPSSSPPADPDVVVGAGPEDFDALTASAAPPAPDAAGSGGDTASPTTNAPQEPPRELVAAGPGLVDVLEFGNARPVSDANLRQALASLVDAPTLSALDADAVLPESGLTPSGWPGSVPVAPPLAAIERARLALSLVPEDQRSLRLVVDASDGLGVRRAADLEQRARGIGLDLVVEALPPQDYQRRVTDGDLDATFRRLSPDVAHAAETARKWAVTGGFGGWPTAPGQRAFTGQLQGEVAAPSAAPPRATDPQDSPAAFMLRFEDTVRRSAWTIPFAAVPYRAAVAAGVQGGGVALDGGIDLDRMTPRQSKIDRSK